MTTRVYQIIIDEAKYDEVNASDWHGVAWGKAYLDITTGGWKQGLSTLVNCVVEHGLVRHTLTIETDNLDDVFAAGNGMQTDVEVHTHCSGKSISVGDILVNAETHEGHIVHNVGFISIDPAIIRDMECEVLRQKEPLVSMAIALEKENE